MDVAHTQQPPYVDETGNSTSGPQAYVSPLAGHGGVHYPAFDPNAGAVPASYFHPGPPGAVAYKEDGSGHHHVAQAAVHAPVNAAVYHPQGGYYEPAPHHVQALVVAQQHYQGHHLPAAKQPEEEETAGDDKPGFVSVNLRAFNMYAAKIRPSSRLENPNLSGQEVERLIGQRWNALSDLEREVFLQDARKEREDMVEKGLIDPNTPQRRRRRKREEIEAEKALMQVGKRKRGRPSKSDLLARQAIIAAAQAGISITDPQNIAAILAANAASSPGDQISLPSSIGGDGVGGEGGERRGGGAKRGRKKKVASPLQGVQANLIGQQVHGVLDGTFDAGYFITVRLGNTDTLLRGVVFAPGISVPLSAANDVAPHLGKAERTPLDGVKFPSLSEAMALGHEVGQGHAEHAMEQEEGHVDDDAMDAAIAAADAAIAAAAAAEAEEAEEEGEQMDVQMGEGGVEAIAPGDGDDGAAGAATPSGGFSTDEHQLQEPTFSQLVQDHHHHHHTQVPSQGQAFSVQDVEQEQGLSAQDQTLSVQEVVAHGEELQDVQIVSEQGQAYHVQVEVDQALPVQMQASEPDDSGVETHAVDPSMEPTAAEMDSVDATVAVRAPTAGQDEGEAAPAAAASESAEHPADLGEADPEAGETETGDAAAEAAGADDDDGAAAVGMPEDAGPPVEGGSG